MTFLNMIFCFVIAYVAFAFLAHRHPPRRPKEIVMQCGLAAVFAFAAFAALVPMRIGAPHWWTVSLRGGLSLVAVMLYDMQFGLERHWSIFIAWAKRWKRWAQGH